jgi:hypothetical protein
MFRCVVCFIVSLDVFHYFIVLLLSRVVNLSRLIYVSRFALDLSVALFFLPICTDLYS